MADVVIIGGGPAGSALGSYLSLAGISNVILEGANHPRAHVGESLVMSTVKVMEEIGFLPFMEEEGFVKKYGASWHAPNGNEFATVFAEIPQMGIKQPYTYHVNRQKFDLYLLKHAEKLGSQVSQGVRVVQVLFDDGRAVGVRAKVGDVEFDIPAKMVVDASGRGTLLGNQLKMKIKDPIFDQYAVHAWFKDLDRGEGDTADYIHIYFLNIERGWVWQIPITDEITSVGVVADKKVLKGSNRDLESYFNNGINFNPALVQTMRNSVRINEFKTEGDYSYKMNRLVGNGWLVIGDAARFVDPIFSSGVSVALFCAMFASKAIKNALEVGDTSESVLMPYETKIREGVEIWYEFIRLYYRLMPLFTHFIQSSKYRLDVIRLLQGEVFDRDEVSVLDAMRNYIDSVEKSDSHILKKNILTDIPLD